MIFKTLIIIIILFFLNVGNPNYKTFSSPMTTQENYSKNQTVFPILVRQQIHEHLVTEVKKVVDNIAPDSKINVNFLVRKCEQYKVDIRLVLAQGIAESHLGTKGKALYTKSIFNVGTFDNGEVRCTYNDVNESIEPYLQLLRTEYLVKKNVDNLIQDNGFENIYGDRYATSLYYEQQLRFIIETIDQQSYIKMYQETFNLTNTELLSYFSIENKELLITFKQK